MGYYSAVKERVISFIKSEGISTSAFEKSSGLSNGFVKNIGKSIGMDKLEKILKSYPNLNGVWLMTGEGEMLKPSNNGSIAQISGGKVAGDVQTTTTNNYGSSEANALDMGKALDQLSEYRRLLSLSQKEVESLREGNPPPYQKIVGSEVEVVSMDNYIEVPFYDLTATAGLPSDDSPTGWVETRTVPRQYRGQEYSVVRISGDSMDDDSRRSLCHGDEIIVKREIIDQANTLPIRSKLFVVDTTEGAVVKQILELNLSEGYVLLHSFNAKYPDYKVHLSEVRGFYSVQCVSLKSIRF